MKARALAIGLAVLVLTGCGGEDPTPTERSESPPLPTGTPTATATPTPDPTASAPSAPAPPPDAGVEEGHGAEELRNGEDQEGGGGDEEEARTPVRVVVDGEGVTPPSVEVPAFIALRITVRNDLPRAIRVRAAGKRFSVRARGRRTVEAGGLKRGRHAIDAGVAGRGVIVAR